MPKNNETDIVPFFMHLISTMLVITFKVGSYYIFA